LTAPQQRRRLAPLISILLAFAVLVGLGTWQLQRKAWKEDLIATLTARLDAAPEPLLSPTLWPRQKQAADEYRRVTFSAAFDHAKEALVYAAPSAFRPDVSGPGYWVLTPARLADGSTVIVNRGFVPEGRQDPTTRALGQVAGTQQITGAMRWPDQRHWFTPQDDPARNLWFVRDPAAIAAAKGLAAVAPFYVEQEAPVPPGGLPQPGKLAVALADNHLQYAITWYGLALALLAVSAVYAFRSRGEAC
jgi:surfeit locus 1 family protein